MTEPKRTRRGNLESTISTVPNAAGYYEAKVWMGVRGDGSPDRRTRRRKTLPALRKAVRELENSRDAGRITAAGKAPTVRQMLERHLDVILPSRDRSPATIASYRSLCRNEIYPRWGAQRADRLLPDHIEEGLLAMRRRGLEPATVRKVYMVLRGAYAIQVQRKALKLNPCLDVEPPEAPESDLAGLAGPEAQAVVSAAAGTPSAARWAFGLGLGLRQGEALGLRWSDIDLESGEMTVRRQLQRLTWQHGCADAAAKRTRQELTPQERAETEHACAAAHCKKKPCPRKCGRHKRACPPPCPPDCTDHARLCPDRALPPGCTRVAGALVLRPLKEKKQKTVWLADEFTALLAEHRDAQYLQRIQVDAEWADHGLVFCQWNGNPVDPRRDYGEWCAILRAAGISHHRLHAMRHSAATIMLEEGIALAVVQQMLGHSDIRMTRRYSHVSRPLTQHATGRTARALLPGKTAP
jgi:integrase